MDSPFNINGREAQQDLLRRFVGVFLPPRGKRHRNMANELTYVTTTLSRVMLRYFGFRADRAMVLEALRRNGCVLFTKYGRWSETHGRVLLTLEQDFFEVADRLGKPQTDDAEFIYVDISSADMRALRSCTIPIPSNTGEEKRRQREEMEGRLRRWRERYALRPGDAGK